MFGFSFLKGLGIGATAFYFFDPVAGARRRSLMRDQFVAMGHTIERFVEKGSRDLNNRLTGVMARMSACCHAEEPSSHQQVIERVRSTMGRYVSHPRAIDIQVDQGRVILSGEILAEEAGPFLDAVHRVRGVHEVMNQLDLHHEADSLRLQGPGRHLRQRRSTTMQYGQSPAAQLVAAAAGTVLIASGLLRNRPTSLLAGCVGCGLLFAAMNQSRRAAPNAGSNSGDGQSSQSDFMASQWEFTAHS